jgi:hypothetical protein
MCVLCMELGSGGDGIVGGAFTFGAQRCGSAAWRARASRSPSLSFEYIARLGRPELTLLQPAPAPDHNVAAQFFIASKIISWSARSLL